MRRMVEAIGSVAVLALAGGAQSSEWNLGPDLNISRVACGVAVDPAGNIYAVGGLIDPSPGPNGNSTDTVEVLDVDAENGSWVIMAPTLNTPRAQLDAVCIGGYLYAIGGSNIFDNGGVYYATVERLDLLQPNLPDAKWEPIASLSVAREGAGAVTDDYGRIYVIGGSNAPSVVLSVVERYDPARPEAGWVTLPPLNEPRNGPAARDSRGRIYAIGGNLGEVATVERFDPVHPEDGWVFVAPVPSDPRHLNATTGADGRIYVLGGVDSESLPLDQCLRYDPESDDWGPWTPMPAAIYLETDGAVTDGNGIIWQIGGYPHPSIAPTTYRLTGPCGADLARPILMDDDADGAIGITDLLALLARWGVCP